MCLEYKPALEPLHISGIGLQGLQGYLTHKEPPPLPKTTIRPWAQCYCRVLGGCDFWTLQRRANPITLTPIASFPVKHPDGGQRLGRGGGLACLVLPFSVFGFGFRVSGFWLRISGLEFGVWGLGFLAPGFGFRVLGFWLQFPGFGFLASGFWLRVSSSGFRASGFGFRA